MYAGKCIDETRWCHTDATVQERLEEMRKDAPQAWNGTYKMSLEKRESLSKIQDTEAAKIKEDTAAFDKKVQGCGCWDARLNWALPMDLSVFRPTWLGKDLLGSPHNPQGTLGQTAR